MTTTQWHWMMDWCKKNMLHPGESWVWQAAEQAYADSTKEINRISDTVIEVRSDNVWRLVKETDIPLTNDEHNVKMGVSQGDGEPTLELSVDECKEAMRKLETFNVTDLSVKICRFLKDK